MSLIKSKTIITSCTDCRTGILVLLLSSYVLASQRKPFEREKVEVLEADPNWVRNVKHKFRSHPDPPRLTSDQCRKLVRDMHDPQSRRVARDVAKITEDRTSSTMERLSVKQRASVRRSILNYTQDSTQINGAARSDKISTDVQLLDRALEIMSELTEQEYKTLYRSMTYPTKDDIPYGTLAGNSISVGDYVTDNGFVSTSETKQFVQGVQQTNKNNTILKLVIRGKNGIPIAGDTMKDYSNRAEAAVAEMNKQAYLRELGKLKKRRRSSFLRFVTLNLVKAYPKEYREQVAAIETALKEHEELGPHAGQAEVLFKRNTVWRVESINRETLSVVLIEVDMTADIRSNITLKNMYTGRRIGAELPALPERGRAFSSA